MTHEDRKWQQNFVNGLEAVRINDDELFCLVMGRGHDDGAIKLEIAHHLAELGGGGDFEEAKKNIQALQKNVQYLWRCSSTSTMASVM